MNKTHFSALIISLFILINLPDALVNKIRYINISYASLGYPKSSSTGYSIKNSVDFQKLLIQNNQLKNQLEAVKEWLQFDERIDDLFQKYNLIEKNLDSLKERDFFRRREEELANLIKYSLQAVPSKVIFRDPTLWSNCLWIDIGEKNNESLEKVVVAINSPVVFGNSLIGVIDYVGKKKSRVRLITDPELIPSVRAIRGNSQNQELLKILKNFELQIQSRADLFDTDEQLASFFNIMDSLKKKASKDIRDCYLAKGQLQGLSAPLWRDVNTLKGIGFNYDYADEEGPARDLRTGDSLTGINKHPQVPILKEGDLLITTGMDGIFPPGLNVAIVTSIDDLEDGGYAYSLKAKPSAGSLHEIQSVFVLPPSDGGESSFSKLGFE